MAEPKDETADIVVQECAACSSPAQPEHAPCCSSPMHGKALCCLHYCKYHYVEVNKCSPETHRADRLRLPSGECRWCPPGCRSCEPDDCECYTHQDEPDKAFVLDEDFDAQAEFLRSLGLDPDTATHADLLAALPVVTPPAKGADDA